MKSFILASVCVLASFSCVKNKSNRSASASSTPSANQNPEVPNTVTGGNPTGTATCEFSGEVKTCDEYTILPAEAFSSVKSTCEESKGVYTANALCSRTGMIGGCTQGGSGEASSASKLVTYYYSPFTVDQVKEDCQSQSETFVQP